MNIPFFILFAKWRQINQQINMEIFIIVAVALLLIAVIILILCHRKGPKDTFPESELAQPPEFYERYVDQTRTYLTRVYPAGKETFAGLSAQKLASFYNSLTFYYNVQFQYNKPGLIGGAPNAPTTWAPLSRDSRNYLPYPPQGYFYSFAEFEDTNMPVVYSDSDPTAPHLNLTALGSCRPGLTFSSEKGQREFRTGPGMQWVNCRTLERHVWYPNGPSFDPQTSKWTVPIPLDIGKITWDYPHGWVRGRPSNEFVEVTHFYHGPGGVTTSPGYWYNCFVGTGIFLSLGKTFTATCKMGAVFGLADLLSKSLAGRASLLKFFGSVDPYEITYGFYGNRGFSGKDFAATFNMCARQIVQCGNNDTPDSGKGILGVMSNAGQLKYPSHQEMYNGQVYTVNSFNDSVVAFQKSIGISGESPTPAGIRASIDAAISLRNYYLYKFSTSVAGDEPLFFMGVLAGFDTIQLPLDPNSNGFFVYEVVDLRLPVAYRERILQRDYSQIVPPFDIARRGEFAGQWNLQFVADMHKFMYDENIITMKDPLNPHDESKVIRCPAIIQNGQCVNNNTPGQNNGWLNMFCADSILSDIYKCVSLGADMQPFCDPFQNGANYC